MINESADLFAVHEIVDILKRHGGFKILERLSPLSDPTIADTQPLIVEGDPICKAVVIDTETTGLNPETDKIIEIGLRSIYYYKSGTVAIIGYSYQGFEDPGAPLSEEIKEVTGITDANLCGQRFDEQYIANIVAGAGLFIAFNADFDRKFIDKRFPELTSGRWACAMAELPWKQWGARSLKMEVVAWSLGWFYDAHRALNDVDALIQLLMLKPPVPCSHNTIFTQLLENARRPSWRIFANGSPFDKKEVLKARQYRWNGAEKVWWKEILPAPTSDASDVSPVDAEVIWLREHASARPTFIQLTAKERYR